MADLEYTKDLWPRSILDTDMYKLTMQQAILHHFPKANVTYAFTNRSKETLFSRECFQLFKASVERLSELKLEENEAKWIKDNCPYFTDDYINYLRSYRFQPKQQVKMELNVTNEPGSLTEEGYLTIDISGLWAETILYEVPLMSILNEAYFLTVDRGWSNNGQEEIAYEKAKQLICAGIAFGDFGTRRRRSYHGHELVLQGLVRAHKEFSGEEVEGRLSNTSNPHFAMKFGVVPISTIAHEWIMGIAAIHGYENANGLAMDLWEETYPPTKFNALYIALTDTFSTDAFSVNFLEDVERAKRWRALRQDSGDPMTYIPKVLALYEKLGIDHRTKALVFSDGLDVESSVKIKKETDKVGFKSAFGIGTFLTNDYKRLDNGERSMPIDMVIKISSVEGKPCVKLSDEITKNTGDPTTIEEVKKIFHISP